MKLNGIHHVVFLTHDLAKTSTFYTAILGMRIHYEGMTDDQPARNHIYFTCGNNTHVSFIEDKNSEHREHLRKGEFQRLGFTVTTKDALRAMREHLLKKQIEVSPIAETNFLHSFYLFDPNGILLEISAPGKKYTAHTLKL